MELLKKKKKKIVPAETPLHLVGARLEMRRWVRSALSSKTSCRVRYDDAFSHRLVLVIPEKLERERFGPILIQSRFRTRVQLLSLATQQGNFPSWQKTRI